MAWREVKFGRDGVIEGVTDGGGGFILPVQMYSIIKTPSPQKMIGLISAANQLIGFYMWTTLALNGLKSKQLFGCVILWGRRFKG